MEIEEIKENILKVVDLKSDTKYIVILKNRLSPSYYTSVIKALNNFCGSGNVLILTAEDEGDIRIFNINRQ